MLGQAKFSRDEMHTALVEIEAILNSRPLSYINSDETEEPLTPLISWWEEELWVYQKTVLAVI